MNTQFIIDLIEDVYNVILEHEFELESLDREIGDGDHYINMMRGLSALRVLREELSDLAVEEALNKIAMSLLSTIGGASGPLLASFFMGMAKSLPTQSGETVQNYAVAFLAGVELLAQRGKSTLGEKTMLDVLIPVADIFKMLAENNMPAADIAPELIKVAEQGCLATKDLMATKGRAAALGERAIGHIDPGAKSCELIIKTVCQRILGE